MVFREIGTKWQANPRLREAATVGCAALIVLWAFVWAVATETHTWWNIIFSVGGALCTFAIGWWLGPTRWADLFIVAAPCVVLVAGAALFVSVGRYEWAPFGRSLEPGHAMRLATSWWLAAVLVGASIYAVSRALDPDQPADRRPFLFVGRALLAVVAALPFVLDGVSNALEARVLTVDVHALCDGESRPGQLVGERMAVQWIAGGPRSPEGTPDWGNSQVVAIVNGQALADLEVPPLLGQSQVFYRRYLIEGMSASEEVRSQEFTHELRDGIVRAITLGASQLVETPVNLTIDLCDLDRVRQTMGEAEERSGAGS